MDSRELAVQQFGLIRNSVQEETYPSVAATAWLQKYVMPAIAEYWERPQFRNQVTWSIRKLNSSAASDECRCIEQLECCIRRVSKTILNLAARAKVSRRIEKRFADTSSVLTGGEAFVTHPNSLKRFTSGNFKLTDIHDYFEPVQEFVDHDGKLIQRGELVLALNAQFIPIGDLIVQTMLRRIESAEGLIRGAHQTVLAAVSQTASSYKAMTVAEADAMNEFDASVSAVRPNFANSAAAQLRQACCVLAQVYAARNPTADCGWLGLPEPLVKTGRNSVDVRLKSGRGPQIFLGIANALSELAKLYQGEQESSEIDEAIAQCRLVIVEESQRVWWDQHEFLIQLSPNDFKTLLLLSKRAFGQRVVSESDVYSEPASRSRWPTMIARLKERLPDQLAYAIIKGKVPRTYRLDVPGEQVHVVTR